MQAWGFQRPAGNGDQPSTLPVRAKPSGFCFPHASAHARACTPAKSTGRVVAKSSRCDLWMEIGAQHGTRTKRARITNCAIHHFSFTHYISSIPLQRKQFLGGERSMSRKLELLTKIFASSAIHQSSAAVAKRLTIEFHLRGQRDDNAVIGFGPYADG